MWKRVLTSLHLYPRSFAFNVKKGPQGSSTVQEELRHPASCHLTKSSSVAGVSAAGRPTTFIRPRRSRRA
jgi:hypothetical protein